MTVKRPIIVWAKAARHARSPLRLAADQDEDKRERGMACAAPAAGRAWGRWLSEKGHLAIISEKAHLATGACALTPVGCELYTAPPNGTLIPDEGARLFC